MKEAILNRKQAPVIRRPDSIYFPSAEQAKLDNGAAVYLIPGGTQDIVHIEIVFPAGKWQQGKPEVAAATAHLLMEGTHKRSARQIAERLDGLGAHLKAQAGTDQGKIIFSGLNKQLEAGLQLIREILLEPLFPEIELEKHIRASVQELEVLQTQREWLASRRFSEMLYGEKHPYGLTGEKSELEVLTKEDILHFYEKQYRLTYARIYVAGKVSAETHLLLNKYLGDILPAHEPLPEWDYPVHSSAKRIDQIQVDDSSQCSILIGKRIPVMKHEDAPGIFILNALLGGFFGSRLMKKLREEAGYTYNVYSMVTDLEHDSYFFISTEVGKHVLEPAKKEIYLAIRRLQEELVSEEELNLLTNYLLGDMMVSMDGPFNQLREFEDIVSCGLAADYFPNFAATIRDMSAKRLQELAIKYLDRESLFEVTAGQLNNLNE